MPFTYPIARDQVAEAKKAIESSKRRFDFESVITRAMRSRVLKIKGWCWETWDDREPFIQDLLKKEYNPELCAVLVDPDPKRFHDWTGRNTNDKNSPITRKGHDEIRRIISKVIRAVFPELDDGLHNDLRFGCESVLFFYFIDNNNRWAR